MKFPELIEHLKAWSDAFHVCTVCGNKEPLCDCRDVHGADENGRGKNWTPTDESRVMDEAVEAIELLLGFAERACPKCDGCGELLLQGGVVEADGITKKPARVVCMKCRDPNFVKEPPRAALSLQDWTLSGDDAEEVLKALARGSALPRIDIEPLKPFVPPKS